jgi:hypothetical protein
MVDVRYPSLKVVYKHRGTVHHTEEDIPGAEFYHEDDQDDPERLMIAGYSMVSYEEALEEIKKLAQQGYKE